MKRIKVFSLFCICFMLGILSINAAECSDKTVAKNVKAKYELKNETDENYDPCPGKECGQSDWTVAPPKGYYYNLIVNNLTDDMYVEISNDYNDNFDTEEGQATYPEKDVINADKFQNGTLTYESLRVFYSVNYTIDIYSKSNSCLLKTIKLKTPLVNEYVSTKSDICAKIPDFEYCQEWVDESISEDNFYKKAQDYANKNNVNIKNEIPDEYKEKEQKQDNKNKMNNIKLILISVVILLAIVTIVTGVIVRGKSK